MTFLDRAKRLLFIGDMRRRTRNKSHRDIDRVGNEKRKKMQVRTFIISSVNAKRRDRSALHWLK